MKTTEPESFIEVSSSGLQVSVVRVGPHAAFSLRNAVNVTPSKTSLLGFINTLALKML